MAFRIGDFDLEGTCSNVRRHFTFVITEVRAFDCRSVPSPFCNDLLQVLRVESNAKALCNEVRHGILACRLTTKGYRTRCDICADAQPLDECQSAPGSVSNEQFLRIHELILEIAKRLPRA